LKNFLFLVLALLTIPFVGAQTTIAVDAQSPEKYDITRIEADSIYDKVKKLPDESQLSFAVIKDGKTRYYGIHRKNDSIFSITNHQSVFEIGSISKVFTATLLAGFVLEGKLQLQDHINSYLDIPFKEDQKVSFQDLSNHTSGLPRLPTNLILDFEHRNNPYARYDETKLKSYLRDTMALSEVTKQGEFGYSNLGAGLLGYTLAQIEKTDYQSLLETRITGKYGMQRTTTNRAEISEFLVPGRNGGTIVPNWDLAVLMGAGGIVSSTEDLAKFTLAQFDIANKEMLMTRTKTVQMNENTSIGLGWFIYTTTTNKTIHTHDGGTGGYTSSMLIDCDSKNGVVVLSNISALGQGTEKVNQISKALLSTLDQYK